MSSGDITNFCEAVLILAGSFLLFLSCYSVGEWLQKDKT